MKFKKSFIIAIPLVCDVAGMSQVNWGYFLGRYRYALRILGFSIEPTERMVDSDRFEMWLHGSYSQKIPVTLIHWDYAQASNWSPNQLAIEIINRLGAMEILEKTTLPIHPLTQAIAGTSIAVDEGGQP
jgi:hypothetical protein